MSLLVAIDKPAGMTSHDVVNRVRHVFGERRCGHMGTLDPDATEMLAVGVGPATRLSPLLTAHDKTYEFTIVFGSATDTDDARGAVIKTAPVPEGLFDPAIAASSVASLIGPASQIPPAFSAVKIAGRKACDQARQGRVIDLSPRDVEIHDAFLIGVEPFDDAVVWRVRANVSAGTYVRSIARDLGYSLGICAHAGKIRRLQAGRLNIGDCVTLEQLQYDPNSALLDPVKILGMRFYPLDEDELRRVKSGSVIFPREGNLFCRIGAESVSSSLDSCTGDVCASADSLVDGECICMVSGRLLEAVYQFDEAGGMLKSRCGFAVGVKRGPDI